MSPAPHVVASLVRTGQGMAVVGLVLGGACLYTTRPGSRPARGAYNRGQDWMARVLAVPLLVVGVIGVVLWIVGSL